MPIQKLHPYLNFNGNADKAIALYEQALGAKLEHVMRFGDSGIPVEPQHKNLVMHAALRLGEGVLMLSDGRPDQPVKAGNNSHVCLQFDEPSDLQTKFDALALGGKVDLPVQDTFWGAKFGLLTDAFGVHWMFNCELKKA